MIKKLLTIFFIDVSSFLFYNVATLWMEDRSN